MTKLWSSLLTTCCLWGSIYSCEVLDASGPAAELTSGVVSLTEPRNIHNSLWACVRHSSVEVGAQDGS